MKLYFRVFCGKSIRLLCYNKHMTFSESIDEINVTNIQDVIMILKLENGVYVRCNFNIRFQCETEDVYCYFNISNNYEKIA